MTDPQFKRRKKLIEPRIQLRFAALFLALSSAAVLVQTIVIVSKLQQVAAGLPNDGIELLEEIPGILAGTGLLTLALLLPLSLTLGIRSTFCIVGPLYRFRVHLGQVARGEHPGPCRIRRTDELHDLCELINRTLERIPAEPARSSGGGPEPRAALPAEEARSREAAATGSSED